MSIQLSDLTVTDPLAEQEVTIVVRVLPDNARRPARTALVSVGTAGQPPVFVSGALDDVADLIRQAWLAYGVQVEVRQDTPGDVATEAETVAEAVVGDDTNEDGEDETPPAAPAQPQPAIRIVPPKPQPQNLSLF